MHDGCGQYHRRARSTRKACVTPQALRAAKLSLNSPKRRVYGLHPAHQDNRKRAREANG